MDKNYELDVAPKLYNKIGKGACGEVYVGELKGHPNIHIAVKVLDKTKTDQKYIEGEINALEKLSGNPDDHIVQLKGHFKSTNKW